MLLVLNILVWIGLFAGVFSVWAAIGAWTLIAILSFGHMHSLLQSMITFK